MFRRFSFGLFFLLVSVALIISSNQQNVRGKNPGVFASEPESTTPRSNSKKRRVIIFGAHPGDPEGGCGGLIARLTSDGHEVILAYATCFRGDRKVDGQPEAVVRRREAEEACKLLGATPHFFEYAHEKLIADESTLDVVSSWLKEVHPDVVVAHWPVDTHPNHHVTGSLVWQSYLRERKWSLYFFEVINDWETVAFKPDLFLDIAEVREFKKEACFCHQSQHPEKFWADHEDMHRLRGEKCGVRYAEAYILAEPLPGRAVLPIQFLKKKI